MKKVIGMIGLGNMGYPMAENLLKKEGRLLVYNRTASRCAPLAEKGAEVLGSPAEMGARADVIVLSLPGPAQVEEVVSALLENGRDGQIILDTSTVDPALSVRLSDRAKQKGIIYVDVPVSGGPAGAAAARLSLMIGGTEEEIAALDVKQYLDTFGSKYFYTGKRGGGNAVKIINNFMAFAAQVINGEAIAMADALGIDLDTFYDVTTQSSGNNMILGAKMAKVKAGDEKPGFATDLVVKDLELARQLCQEVQVPNWSLNTALQFYRLSQRQGHGKDDSSVVIRTIRELAGQAR